MTTKAATKDARGAVMLSGVQCQVCTMRHVFGCVIHRRRIWGCGACGHQWTPTVSELVTFNGRVPPRDQIAIK